MRLFGRRKRDFEMVTFSAVSPLDMLREVNPDAVPADQPPEAANYRPADVQGVACAHCAKFVFTGAFAAADGDTEQIPRGYCSLWEAFVQGDHVSDGFADPGPPLDENGNEIWDFADKRELAEIHLAGTETREEEGFVIKEILRTGEWPVIPTRGGIVPKPLRIIRDGTSNKEEGIIALAELVENFQKSGIQPQIPLSDEEGEDHKNTTALNQGFVRDLWIVDENDGSKLVAKMQFTEPETRQKALRGTYADVSCGIPWEIVSRGQKYGATLEHVAITNRPFIDGLGPFLEASDKKKDAEVVHFGSLPSESGEEHPTPTLSARQIFDSANEALIKQLGLSNDYQAVDVDSNNILIVNRIAETSWKATYKIEDGKVTLANSDEWQIQEDEGKREAPVEQKPTAPRRLSDDDDLDAARRLREIRLSQSQMTRAKEDHMPLTREELDRLNLSDEQRAVFQSVLDENAQLARKTREESVTKRIHELEELGLKDRPGALRLYRQVALSDDGGPAIVLLSDDGQEKKRQTAKGLLDDFIAALTVEGKIVLSDQIVPSGNDEPPPAETDDQKKPLADRLAEAKTAIYGAR